MRYLKKLPNSRRAAPGLERKLLRKLPMLVLGGTMIPLLVVIGSHLWPSAGDALDVARHLKTITYFAVASVITFWTLCFTLLVGCIVVVVMKGPAYVADAYELSDADEPGKPRRREM
ncbi:MAG: hypothetical protein RQ736_03275 [Thiogranum sp.]|nr:hypothetical protein [Thiogranum sp.]